MSSPHAASSCPERGSSGHVADAGGRCGCEVPVPWGSIAVVHLPTLTHHQIHLADDRPPYSALIPVSYTHLRAHETPEHLVCRLLLEKKKTQHSHTDYIIYLH
eukprot:TRINITY_DN14512_c0_g1_i1.p2 TRINITY_DN14512_c0_g1~~TRINITY_DN14512_c0_g1_i1.p2  ORF type:complete len:103 (-),score=6.92 TRINITY_DN14512_c0_g1_i1:31-339(-)